jgi:hypothetical protein
MGEPRPLLAGIRTGRGNGRAGRYGWLLLLILAAIAVPLVLPGSLLGTAVVAGLQAATVVAAFAVAETTPRARSVVLAIVVGAAAVVAGIALLDPYTTLSTDLPQHLGRGLGLLLALAVPVIIVRDVATHPRITLQTVAAGLCVYLLLGLAFAFAHGLVDGAIPSAYTQSLGEDDAIYLSFVTLTTVGFGDLTPVVGLARAVTVVEAVVGQIYLVSIVALLVGNVGVVRSGGERGAGDRGAAARDDAAGSGDA